MKYRGKNKRQDGTTFLILQKLSIMDMRLELVIFKAEWWFKLIA